VLKGMYISANAALSQGERYDILANNLANVNTTGFKPQRPQFSEVLAQIVGRDTTTKRIESYAGATLSGAGDVFVPGVIEHTENMFDVAIIDEGLFAVERDGKFYYTRAGAFHVAADGYLVAADGKSRVLLENGVPIVIGNSEFEVDGRGFVTLVNAENERQPLGNLWVVRPRQGNYGLLARRGDNLWSAPSSVMERVEDVKVSQGAIEKSAVSAVEEMTSLISAMRAYEAAMRFVKIQDEALGLAVSELARPLG